VVSSLDLYERDLKFELVCREACERVYQRQRSGYYCKQRYVKYMLIINEVGMLGVRTLYAVNERLRTLRGCSTPYRRSILLPSTAIAWDEGKIFKAEQRYQHDKAHALWKRFTTVVLLKEQVRVAGDLKL